MSYEKITNCLSIIQTCSVALGKVAVPTAERFNTLMEACEDVRGMQEEVAEVDWDECTVSGMMEYLTASKVLAVDALAKAAVEIAADILTPAPLPTGIVLVSGS